MCQDNLVMIANVVAGGGVRLTISPRDQALLSTLFYISNPARLPDLRTTIPAPDEVAVDKVEGIYEIAAGQAERHKWVRCCECRHDHNHKRGFVLKFSDGTRATVGRDCAREDHSLDFDTYMKAFEGRRSRARRLRQIVMAVQVIQQTANHLRLLREDPALLAALRIRYELEARLPDLYRRLHASSDGIIKGGRPTRDLEEEKRRDERLESKLEAIARRKNVGREDPGTDQALLEELRASGDPDASKEPIMVIRPVELVRYVGAGFLTLLPDCRRTAARLEADLFHALNPLNGKGTAEISDMQLDAIRRQFTRTLDAAAKLCREIVSALRFVEQSNVAGIVRAANRFSTKTGAGKLAVSEGRITRDTPTRVEVSLALPPTSISMLPLQRALRQIDEAALSEEETPEQRSAA
jgi:hypothetical protein